MSSRVLGLVRDVVQGMFFGTGDKADAFAVATRIPTLLRDLFAEGAMSAAFVPTISRYLTQQGKPAAWRLGSQVINGLVAITGVLVVAGIVFADPITRRFGSGFTDTPEKIALTIELTRINMPFLLLISVAAACMGMLNALRKFFVPAFSPALYNVVFILAMVIMVPLLRQAGYNDVIALSTGMLAGGVAQIVAQWPALRREGYRHTWALDPRDPGLREILVLMAPGTIGAAAAQINLVVNTWLATHLDGAASALQYAFRLMYMPIGIIGVSVATAAIPTLARQAAEGSTAELRSTLSWGLRLMLVLGVPATVGLMVLARPIVELIFQYGHFTAASTTMVAGALLFYAPGIIGYSIVKIASPTFYAFGNARTPLVVSIITIAVNLILNITLFPIISYRGLALGTSLAATVNATLLLVFLSRRIGGIDGRRVAVTLAKILVASIAMGAAAYFTESWLAAGTPAGGVAIRLMRVFGAIAAGVATLGVVAWMLHIAELREAVARLGARFRRPAS
jgi:putative peptidoglycan lipid II flippase